MNTNDIFDQAIIGQESVKESLRKISDMVKDREAYESCGARVPTAVLLTGAPKTGKRTLCRCLADDIGFSTVTFRNSADLDKFKETLEQCFKELSENIPAILTFENIHTYDEEAFKCLQEGLDACCGKDVLVLATAISPQNIPVSVMARFDRNLTLHRPVGDIWTAIVDKYIREEVSMHLAEELFIKDIAMILEGHDYADLEEVMSKAAANAVYEHALAIRKEDVIKAVLEVSYRYEEGDMTKPKAQMESTAIHEACHAVVCEVLFPGNVSFISVPRSKSYFYGVSDSLQLPHDAPQDIVSEAMISLAGMAGEEVFLGKLNGVGSRVDLQQAMGYIDYLITECYGAGFSGLVDKEKEASEQKKAEIEKMIEQKLEKCYSEVKDILKRSRAFVEALSKELMQKGTLLNSDVMRIKALVSEQAKES